MITQEEKTSLIQVAIPLPITGLFTYRLPEHLASQARVGLRVRVPFRNRTITGFIVDDTPGETAAQPKDVLEILDSKPVLDDHLLRLAKWIANYYFSSWGEAIQNMLPKYVPSHRAPRRTEAVAQTIPAPAEKPVSIQLNEEQAAACSALERFVAEKKFHEVFLFGVTGGGKSELYIRTIKEVLKQGKSVICLVPEIALTEQIKRFFVHHFHDQLEILHSKLTDRERWNAWERIRAEEKRVVLGARSAVFAPAPNLGLIIMDEEQEGSYKQDQTPRYHAREVARWRACDMGALFLMGTATPTLETMHRVKAGEVVMLTLTKRFDGREMPAVKIIDLKQAQDITKKLVIISPQLERAIEENLRLKNGILLLLNRRGFSTHIRCLQCQDVLNCPNCAVCLTYHQETEEALCHYCNYHMKVPPACSKCKHAFFKFSGIGTEKVESEVARLFPNANVARLDRDTARKRGAHEDILSRFRSGEIDILIGTQMIAKGFDFPHVTLAGIVNADTGLLLPDFRSSERTFQLLAQMAGRAGRGKHKGTVLIQTYSPEHYAIRHASKHEYAGFFSEELERRRSLSYPPFKRLINVMFRGKKEKDVYETSLQFAKAFEQTLRGEPVELIGPAPLPLYRLRGHYRWHLMLRSDDFESRHALIEKALAEGKVKRGVHFAVDADPMSIL